MIQNRFQTGDILLFSGKGRISEWIKRLTNSNWSHCGVVIHGADGSPYLFESTTLSDIADVRTGKIVKGVMTVDIAERVAAYDGEVVWQPVIGKRPLYADHLVASVEAHFSGRPYEQDFWQLLKAALDWSLLEENQRDTHSLFCSELVAEVWVSLGFLDKRFRIRTNEVVPADFAAHRLPLAHPYQWGPISRLPLISGDRSHAQ